MSPSVGTRLRALYLVGACVLALVYASQLGLDVRPPVLLLVVLSAIGITTLSYRQRLIDGPTCALFIGGFVLFELGDLVAYTTYLRGLPAPALPSLQDLFYFAGYPFYVAAITRLYAREWRNAFAAILFSVTLSVAVGFVLWATVFSRFSGGTVSSTLSAAAYPVLDLMLVLGVVQAIVVARLDRRVSAALFAGTFAFLLADLGYAFVGLRGPYYGSSYLPGLYVLAYAFVASGIAAVPPHQSASMGTATIRLSPGRVALMFLASAVAPFALIAVHVDHLNAYASAGWVVVIVVLVFAQFAALLRERGAAETRLRTRERELQTLVDNAPDLIVRYGVDKRFIYANAPVEEIVGASSGAARQNMFEADPDASAAIDRVLATEAQIDVTYERTTEGGVRQQFEARFVPQFSESGAIESIISIARDVTEAHEARSQLAFLVSRMPALLWATDRDLRPVSVSGGALYELAWGADPLQRLSLLVETPEFSAFKTAHRRALDGELVELDQAVDGRVLRCHVEPLTNARGERVGAIGVGLDVTEQSRLQEQILHAQKMEAVSQLAGTIAHDFNNLLTGISGYAEFAASKLDGHPAADDVAEIKRASDRGASLTNRLAIFSRKRVVETRVIDANGIVAGMSAFLTRVIGESMTVRYALDPAPAAVKIDPRQLEQVILNLAINARDAMDGRGELRISTRTESDRFVLEVADQGIGMDESTRLRIFDPFYTTKEPGKGTGLGLASVHAIVSEAGGSIAVVSEPEAGATFTVFLPVDPSAPDHSVAQDAGPVVGGDESILLVDDNEQVRQLTEKMLQALGYRVFSAETSQEALRLASRDAFHLLVTDIVLPDTDGRRLAGEIAAVRPEIGVVFISGFAPEDVPAEPSLGAARQAFLAKPFGLRELATAIRVVLDDRVLD